MPTFQKSMPSTTIHTKEQSTAACLMYLFTDEKFVNHLLSKNKNIFTKIYDEIKYLVKMVTGVTVDEYTHPAKHLEQEETRPSGLVEVRQSKPNTPSWVEKTNLHLLPRYLAARPSGLVDATGIEPVSKNPLI